MVSYAREEARSWSRENMHGCANVVIPSFTNDLGSLNEAGIRHDIRHEIELGFSGTLLVSETATTHEEYVDFVRIAADEAQGRLQLIFHAAFDTLELNIEMARRAEAAGAEIVLLSYPSCFYPASVEDIYEYTKAFCESTPLAVILFPVPLWGFERLEPASISIDMIRRLVDDIPNLVAVKAEGGMPTVAGFAHAYQALSDRVIVTFPMEADAIPLLSLVPFQWMGTSCMEYYGGAVPEMFSLMSSGQGEKAMQLYWSLSPARRAAAAANPLAGFNFINRLSWKYMAWLQGFNGGPLRGPTPRLNYVQMNGLRRGLVDSGFAPDEDDADFFRGRNPVAS